MFVTMWEYVKFKLMAQQVRSQDFSPYYKLFITNLDIVVRVCQSIEIC